MLPEREHLQVGQGLEIPFLSLSLLFRLLLLVLLLLLLLAEAAAAMLGEAMLAEQQPKPELEEGRELLLLLLFGGDSSFIAFCLAIQRAAICFHHPKRRDILNLHKLASLEEAHEEPEPKLELQLRQHEVGWAVQQAIIKFIQWHYMETHANPRCGEAADGARALGARKAREVTSCTRHRLNNAYQVDDLRYSGNKYTNRL